MPEVLLTPAFAAAVDEHLAAFEPERMLHALGRVRPDGSVLLSHWVHDVDAEASGAHVVASAAGQAAVQAAERDHGVTYLGVIHSHPRDFPTPSGQDELAVADLLRLNPHLPVALVGVVVSTVTGRRGAEVIDVGRGELVVGVMARGRDRLLPGSLRVVDPARDFWTGAGGRLPAGALAAMRDVHVTVVGAGSLGSTAAEQLVRAGVPRLTLIDPDRVEAANLSRTVYGLADVGRFKVDALAQRLRSINPSVDLDTHAWAVDRTNALKLADIVADSTLVLGMADAPRALAIIDRILHDQDTPGIFAGVYRGAVGADVVTVLPGLTACYQCTVAPRVTAADLAPGIDYTTGRISGAVALGTDVSYVALVAARLSLGLIGLLRGTDTLLEAPVVQGRNYVQLGLAPGFFDQTELFAGVPGQHAYQSLWARGAGDPDCPRCGHLHMAVAAAEVAPAESVGAPHAAAADPVAAPANPPALPLSGAAGTRARASRILWAPVRRRLPTLPVRVPATAAVALVATGAAMAGGTLAWMRRSMATASSAPDGGQ